MMVKNKYNVGDVVQLKSGGPKMTISSVPRDPNPDKDPFGAPDHGQSQYVCNWFKGGTLEHGSFKEELLMSIEPEKVKGK
jgi:uncharacterized protein YodC (DUF2158 family)